MPAPTARSPDDRDQGMLAVRRCFAQLREHFDIVTIMAIQSNADGSTTSIEMETGEQDDEEDD